MSDRNRHSGSPASTETAWDAIAEKGDHYFRAATAEEIENARAGQIQIQLTPIKRVPLDWLGDVRAMRVLCLAAGGGHQGPLLAAAGAEVTVLDISNKQLDRDREVARKFGLELSTVKADMANLPMPDECFDLIVNPCSICYCENPVPVWNECGRVLRRAGRLLTGLINPINYLFDEALSDNHNRLVVANRIPKSCAAMQDRQETPPENIDCPPEFAHSLEQLIGAHLQAGFSLVGFYEDRWGGKDLLSRYIDTFFALNSVKEFEV